MKKILYICGFIVIATLIFVSTSNSLSLDYMISNKNLNSTVNLSTMSKKVAEFNSTDLYSAKDTFVGDLTAYVYNCPACNGHLGCKYTYNIMDGTTIYPDDSYGNVNIVASSSNLPCGSIIRFNASGISDEPVVAIVLDRGVRGNDIDFLASDEETAYKIGRHSISYDVLRSGWGIEG